MLTLYCHKMHTNQSHADMAGLQVLPASYYSHSHYSLHHLILLILINTWSCRLSVAPCIRPKPSSHFMYLSSKTSGRGFPLTEGKLKCFSMKQIQNVLTEWSWQKLLVTFKINLNPDFFSTFFISDQFVILLGMTRLYFFFLYYRLKKRERKGRKGRKRAANQNDNSLNDNSSILQELVLHLMLQIVILNFPAELISHKHLGTFSHWVLTISAWLNLSLRAEILNVAIQQVFVISTCIVKYGEALKMSHLLWLVMGILGQTTVHFTWLDVTWWYSSCIPKTTRWNI